MHQYCFVSDVTVVLLWYKDFRSKIQFLAVSGVSDQIKPQLSWFHCKIQALTIDWRLSNIRRCSTFERRLQFRDVIIFHLSLSSVSLLLFLLLNLAWKKLEWTTVCYFSISRECQCFSEFLNIWLQTQFKRHIWRNILIYLNIILKVLTNVGPLF